MGKASSSNRFAILNSIEEDVQMHVDATGDGSNSNLIRKECCVKPQKTRVASARVTELMKSLKSKIKGPIDKGRSKQTKIGSAGLGGQVFISL